DGENGAPTTETTTKANPVLRRSDSSSSSSSSSSSTVSVSSSSSSGSRSRSSGGSADLVIGNYPDTVNNGKCGYTSTTPGGCLDAKRNTETGDPDAYDSASEEE